MKAVLIGESSGASMDKIIEVYPRHKKVVDEFVDKGVIYGIGPLSGGENMAIFKTKKDAEDFAKADPFVLEGIIKSYVIKDWGDSLLPEPE